MTIFHIVAVFAACGVCMAGLTYAGVRAGEWYEKRKAVRSEARTASDRKADRLQTYCPSSETRFLVEIEDTLDGFVPVMLFERSETASGEWSVYDSALIPVRDGDPIRSALVYAMRAYDGIPPID